MKVKQFDCIEMKRLSSEKIYEQIKNMDTKEELAYWQKATNELKNLQNKSRLLASPDTEEINDAATDDALEILDNLIGTDNQIRQMITESYINAEVGQLIYDARTKEELTHKQLADMIGVEESTLANLEEGDYDGNSLIILDKIATALNQKLKLSLVANR